jgi:hypothetical protein
VAAAFNGTELRLYLDGRPAGSVRANGQPVPTLYDLTIGQNRSTADPASEAGQACFNGMMDDVMMFNRSFSPGEVATLFDSQKAPTDEPAPAPATGPKPNAAERLKQVKSLYEQGLITKEDYDKKVKEVMDSL